MPDSGFTVEEMAELCNLLDVEKIRKVKLLYAHLMDARDILVSEDFPRPMSK